jgi:hypothetical protein
MIKASISAIVPEFKEKVPGTKKVSSSKNAS